jgi:hypothetical protein
MRVFKMTSKGNPEDAYGTNAIFIAFGYERPTLSVFDTYLNPDARRVAVSGKRVSTSTPLEDTAYEYSTKEINKAVADERRGAKTARISAAAAHAAADHAPPALATAAVSGPSNLLGGAVAELHAPLGLLASPDGPWDGLRLGLRGGPGDEPRDWALGLLALRGGLGDGAHDAGLTTKCGAASCRLCGPTSAATVATCDAAKCGAASCRLYHGPALAPPPPFKKTAAPPNPCGWRGCVSLSLCVPVAGQCTSHKTKSWSFFRRALVSDSIWVRFPAAFNLLMFTAQ